MSTQDEIILAFKKKFGETYARMIFDYNGIEIIAKKDFVLKRKIDRMKELMKSFSSEFDDLFWQARVKSSTAAPHF